MVLSNLFESLREQAKCISKFFFIVSKDCMKIMMQRNEWLHMQNYIYSKNSIN